MHGRLQDRLGAGHDIGKVAHLGELQITRL
jgi:hypothetical protein